MITVIHDDDKHQLIKLVPEELLGPDTVCICALEDSSDLSGVLLARPEEENDEVWELSYLYVVERERRKSLATQMLTVLFEILQPLGAMALTFSFLEEEGENAFSGFASHMGFSVLGTSVVYETTLLYARQAVERLRPPRLPQTLVQELKKIPFARWNAFRGELEHWRRDRGIADNRQLYVLPGERENYDGEISFFAATRTGGPAGALLVKSDGENNLAVEYLVSFHPGDPNLTIAMLRQMCDAASARFPVTDTMISFHAFNPNVGDMGKNLLGRKLYEVGKVNYLVRYL